MTGKSQTRTPILRLGAVTLSVLALSACNNGEGFSFPSFGGGGDDQTAAAVAPAASTGEGRDVEAPDVFSVNAQGLWDGRPSLGGVWVAHPDVADPERVIIRNTDNGQFVIGALFRRERENPGPPFQVSSDAAEALGLLAGAPAPLSVIALRREAGPAPAAEATVEFDEAPAVAETALDPVAEIATSAIETAEAATPAPAPAPAPVAAPASSLAKPFLQIGIFSIEDNATRTAERLRSSGLSARIVPGNSQGRDFWRVTVGPAPTAADRDAVLAQVKSLGFTDAYAVTN